MPEKPIYEGEAHFHIEGLCNEHIVATTMHMVEVEEYHVTLSVILT